MSAASPVYLEIIDFIATGTTPEAVTHFQPSAAAHGNSGEIVRLFHPREDLWADHFQLDGNMIRARSEVGAATAGLLRFNAPERLAERSLLQSLGTYPTKV